MGKRNKWRRTVGFVGRDGESTLLTDTHALETFVPSFDNLADTDYAILMSEM